MLSSDLLRYVLACLFLFVAGLDPGCSQPISSEQPDLRVQLDSVSAQGLCCWQSSDDPREPHLRLELTASDCTPTEHRVRRRQCDTVCCLTPGGVSLYTLRGLCDARGGRRGNCPQDTGVCCKDGDQYSLISAQACVPPREEQEALRCDLVCCNGQTSTSWVRAGSCTPVASWVDPRMCDTDAAMGSSPPGP